MPRESLTQVLDRHGVGYELLPHDHTESATAEAAALGVPASEVAKTVVLATPSGNVRAVVPASRKLDLRKIADVLEAPRKQVQLASEDVLARDYAEFELGAVPPLGGSEDAVLVDARLAERESVVLEAGTHEESVRLLTDDLVRLAQARVADITR